MNDEADGLPIFEFVGLRPKMYSFQAVKEKADWCVEFFEMHRRKVYEEWLSGTAQSVLSDLEKRPAIKGEFVVLLRPPEERTDAEENGPEGDESPGLLP